MDNQKQHGWYVRYTPAKYSGWFSDYKYQTKELAYQEAQQTIKQLKQKYPKILTRNIPDPPRKKNKLGIIGIYKDQYSAIASYWVNNKRTHKRFALSNYPADYLAVDAACQFLMDHQPHRKKLITKQLIKYLCKELFNKNTQDLNIFDLLDSLTPKKS